jgi:hypothetical protein
MAERKMSEAGPSKVPPIPAASFRAYTSFSEVALGILLME